MLSGSNEQEKLLADTCLVLFNAHLLSLADRNALATNAFKVLCRVVFVMPQLNPDDLELRNLDTQTFSKVSILRNE